MVLENISRRQMVIVALACALAGALLTIGALYATRVSGELGTGVLALFGVLVGSGISGVVGSVQSQLAARSQVAAATWLKRLEVHQAAFKILDEMLYEEYKDDTFVAALNWWKSNCLYMSSDAMDKFFKALITIDLYKNTTGDLMKRRISVVQAAIKAVIEGAGRHVSDEFIEKMNKKERPTSLSMAGD